MYFKLIIALSLVTIIPVVSIRVVFLTNMNREMRQQKIRQIETYSMMLGTQISNADYLNGQNKEVVDGQIEQFATLYDGRVVVVDSNYTVLADTYTTLNGKTMISEPTLKCMGGTKSESYNETYDTIELAMPINDGESIVGVILVSSSASDILATGSSMSRVSGFIIAGMAVVLLALVIFLAGSFTKPFKGVTKSITRIAEGHFDERVYLKGYSEIEQISDAFNLMVEKLKMQEDSRQEFVSNVSHELKTPITSIKVLADSLNAQEDVPVELYKEFMTDIVDEIDRENTIINDLLSLVKMDKTTAELNISNISINEMLELILKRLRPIAAKRNIELVLESIRPVNADCDEVKLTLAISNLVENAIKYNIAGGWVQVSLNADHKYLYIKVQDSGIGIPQESQDLIFDRFYRVDKARSRESGGTGLGLAITKNIIMMHNGAIKVRSKEDEGTTFTVRIPLTYIN